MSKSNAKEMPVENPDVVIVRTATAAKLSPRGEGGITYQIGRVQDAVYMRIVGNESGGRHSKEWVPLDRVRSAMTRGMLRGEPFKSTAMVSAFEGRSQNNSGFLVAAMRAEGLVGADAKHKGMSVMTGDIDAWELAAREAAPSMKDGVPETVPLHPVPKELKPQGASDGDGGDAKPKKAKGGKKKQPAPTVDEAAETPEEIIEEIPSELSD